MNRARSLRSGLALGLALVAPSLVEGCSQQSSAGGAGVASILFVQRVTTTVAADGTVNIDVADGNGQVVDYTRYEPGETRDAFSGEPGRRARQSDGVVPDC